MRRARVVIGTEGYVNSGGSKFTDKCCDPRDAKEDAGSPPSDQPLRNHKGYRQEDEDVWSEQNGFKEEKWEVHRLMRNVSITLQRLPRQGESPRHIRDLETTERLFPMHVQ